ncbi:metallophosphoesterase [Streptomyces sp. NPDC059063]|uniref:metallophosphoesterase family protein n=1 Tax=unclassified Streptomyces TaxID=2593676 RepID=UPI00369F204E
MTQGAGRGPEVRTATLRDFRVPAYVYEGVRETGQDGAVAQERAQDQAVHAAQDRAPHSAHPQGQVPVRAQGAAQDSVGVRAEGRAGIPPRVPVQPGPVEPGRVEPTPAAGPVASSVPGPVASPVQQDPARHASGAAGQAPAGPVPSGPVPSGQAPAGQPYAVPGAAATGPMTPPAAQTHAGSAGEAPDGYTPTERDLPVINPNRRGDTLQVEVREMPEPPPAPGAEELGPLYVVGDVHGYLDELVAALQEEGLIDSELSWCAGNTRLWFLGDFTDRGPDGIGVIDLVMRLSAEAAAAGGYCKALMGNHELLLIGAKRFGDTPVNSGAGTATFQAAWLLNGGQKTDMERLEDHHLQWMSRLDAIVEEDGHLLVHSDTTAYLDYGDSIEEVNDTIHEALTRNDADEYWDLFRKFTKRFAFRDDSGPQAVRELLDVYGGGRIVHGHSPIPYLLGEVGSEYDADDDGRPVIEGPHIYADGLAIAMDGGVTMAGKLLVCQLPLGN